LRPFPAIIDPRTSVYPYIRISASGAILSHTTHHSPTHAPIFLVYLFPALQHLHKLIAGLVQLRARGLAERVFSLCNVQWTKERNSLKVETVQSLVQTKVNYDFTCSEMYNMLLSDNKLLDRISGWEKYD